MTRWHAVAAATGVAALVAAYAIGNPGAFESPEGAVQGGRQDRPAGEPRQAPPSDEPQQPSSGKGGRAVVWALGDGADGGARARRLVRQVLRDRPDRFLYLGDVYEHGTASEFGRNYHRLYGRLAAVTSPTPGNHEWGNRRAGYDPYWHRASGRPQPPWYRFHLAGWELLSLNSEAPHGPGSPQLRWLEAQLEGPGNCRLAFWHRPRFSAGLVHGDAPDMAPIWKALRGRARAVVNGHEHNLQRFKARVGLTEFVVGAGGHSRYPLNPRDRRLAFGRDDREGALRVELAPRRALFQFRASGGSVLDTTRLGCEPG